jgi:hypothetical protein
MGQFLQTNLEYLRLQKVLGRLWVLLILYLLAPVYRQRFLPFPRDCPCRQETGQSIAVVIAFVGTFVGTVVVGTVVAVAEIAGGTGVVAVLLEMAAVAIVELRLDLYVGIAEIGSGFDVAVAGLTTWAVVFFVAVAAPLTGG